MRDPSSSIQKPDAVFFDWDGTLVDSYAFLNDAHSHVLTALGFEPFRDGEFRQYFGKPREILYRTIYKDKFEDAKALFEIYVMENNHRIAFLDEADRVLETLHGLGVTMGVVSNKKASFIRKEIENFGWGRYFSSVVGAGEAKEDKPSAAPLLLALAQSGLAPETHHIWYVGDTENDLQCAAEAGCPSVFIKGHVESERLMQAYSPVRSVEDCAGLHEFLVALWAECDKNKDRHKAGSPI